MAETAAVRDVLAERRRQIDVEHWTPQHDDSHSHRELSLAAMAYCQVSTLHLDDTSSFASTPPSYWPWAPAWWKPKNRRRNLVKAAALILAEIERLDRAAAPSQRHNAIQADASGLGADADLNPETKP